MQRDRRTFLTVATGALGLIAGCSSGNQDVEGGDHNTDSGGSAAPETTRTTTTDRTTESTTTEETTESAKADISIKDSQLQKQDGSFRTEASIIGTIVNQGDGISGEISLTGRFYDSDGNLLDSTSTHLPYLKPGERWKCHIPYLDDGSKVASQKLDGKFKTESIQLEVDGLSVTDTSLKKDDYGATVAGTIVNNLEEEADYLAAISRFWKDDLILCGGLANITDVPAGENWSFESDSTGYGERASKATDYDVIPELTIY